ncbi:hypothetical protein UPYG_G00049770, partial [Umbra pygmaea]
MYSPISEVPHSMKAALAPIILCTCTSLSAGADCCPSYLGGCWPLVPAGLLIHTFYLPPGTSLTFLWNPTPASSLLITQDHYSSPPASLPSTYSYLRTIPKPSCLPTL